MNIKSIGNGLKRTARSTSFTLKEHSPGIFMAVGAVGTVVGTVVACKATTKLDDILATASEKVAQIKDFDPEMIEDDGIEYTEQDRKKDLVLTYTKTGIDILKLYGPAIAIMAMSLSSILVANNILKKRNFAMMAAYTALDKSFKEYRSRVVSKYGEAIDEEIRYGLEKRKTTEKVTDENGKTKNVKKDVLVATANDDTLIEFSDISSYWDSVMDYNIAFARARQALMNDILIANGYLFMNQVKEAFDLPVDASDYQKGWLYQPNNEAGDNIVDLRIRESLKEVIDKNGEVKLKPVIYMDPNYDGLIVGTKAFEKICNKNKRRR